MALSPEDLQTIEEMKQREFTLKKRRRAISAMHHERRRHQAMLLVVTTLSAAVILSLVYAAARHLLADPLPELWHRVWPALIVGAVLGWLASSLWLRSSPGRRHLARRDRLLDEKYAGELHAGRRWQQFFYKGEEISALIPRVLYTLESRHAADSLDAVLAAVRESRYENPRFRARGQEIFNSLTASTDLIVLSTSDQSGQPSSRLMRFVTSDRPGVWYVTSAPATPKIDEFDLGRAALITVPTENGATISSNRVRLRRADKSFLEVAELYRAQVPSFLNGMSEADQAREVVYELVIESARVSSWEYSEPVDFAAYQPAAVERSGNKL